MDKELLALLVCPEDRTKVEYTDGALRCPKCGKAYEIKEGIPLFV